MRDNDPRPELKMAHTKNSFLSTGNTSNQCEINPFTAM